MTDAERKFEELAKVNASPSTSGLVEQQRWFMKLEQQLDTWREAEVLSQLDAGITSLDAGHGIPASQAFAMLRHQTIER